MSLELSPSACKQLLDVARRALRARVLGDRFLPDDGEAELRRPGGAFVTVRRREGRELRACVGRIDPVRPLIEAVAMAAAAAAAEDGRFDPVTVDELPLLSVEVSALGPVGCDQGTCCRTDECHNGCLKDSDCPKCRPRCDHEPGGAGRCRAPGGAR